MVAVKTNKPVGGPYSWEFNRLCDECGFVDLAKGVRADVMWFAECADEVSTIIVPTLMHPTAIRQAYREATKPAPAEHPAMAEINAMRERAPISADRDGPGIFDHVVDRFVAQIAGGVSR